MASAGGLHTLSKACSTGGLTEHCHCGSLPEERVLKRTVSKYDDVPLMLSKGYNSDHSGETSSSMHLLLSHSPETSIKVKTRYEWGGCHDNTDFSHAKVRQFLEYSHSDSSAMIRRHNTNVGLLVSNVLI